MHSTQIVRNDAPVILIGGGPVGNDALALALEHASFVACADSGLLQAFAYGLDPKAVIGDMDSVDMDLLDGFNGQVIRISEQDSTDFQKAISVIDASLILGVGFLGGRLDHELAVLSGIAQHKTPPVILIGEQDICFACPNVITVTLPLSSRFSLYPITKFQATSQGLKWPLHGLTLDPMGPLGTSNEVAAEGVQIEIIQGDAICILPTEHLDAAIAALTGGNVDGEAP